MGRFSSRDAAVVPVMAVVSAVGHMAVGPFVNRALHLPGPTLAGVVILAPLLVAGTLTLRRGVMLLTSTLNGLLLSAFVPIGFLAIPIYAVVGLMLELFSFKSFARLLQPWYSSVAAGAANGLSVFLIATVALGMKNPIILGIAVGLGFVTGAIGGLIASLVARRVKGIQR